MIEVSAGILMAIDGTAKDVGARFLSTLRACSSGLAPRKCGNVEPLTSECSTWTVDRIVDQYWNDMFLWSAMQPGTSGLFSMSRHDVHCGPFIYGRVYDGLFGELKALFEAVVQNHPVDFGWIHMMGDPEWDDLVKVDARRLLAPFNHGIFSRELARGVPNLAWTTIFGPPYFEKVNDKRLSDVARTWRVTNEGAIFVQLTDSPLEAVESYERFRSVRERAREEIGTEMFQSPGRDAEWVPVFARRSTPPS